MTAETALIASNRQARRGQVHPPAAIVARSEGDDPSAGSLMDRGGASLQLLALCQARRERGVIAIRRGRPRPPAPRIPPGSAGEQDLGDVALPAGRGCRRGAVLRLPDRRAPRRRAGDVARVRSGENPARPLREGGLLPAGVRSRGRQAAGLEPGAGATGCPAAPRSEPRPGWPPAAATSAGNRDHLRDARPRLHAESEQRRPARAAGAPSPV